MNLSIVGSKLKYKDIKAVEFDIECKDDFYFNTELNSCLKIFKFLGVMY